MTELQIPILLLALVFAVVAFFYASVGLGGGSSYTALLALAGASVAVIPMVSLTLNLLVTSLGSIVFLSKKHGRLRLITPFLVSSVPMALFCGAVLGLVAGICGIGGGVYLVPLIILLGLGTAKEAAACGSFFIWANSIAGIASRLQYNRIDLAAYTPLIIGAVAGGLTGSLLGAGHFEQRTMEKILGGVLVVAIFFLGRKIAMIMM
jgi:uncharacterized membrane protein YfcA